MNEELMKSLVALIDESLAEIEELKKSDRFSATEIKIGGPGDGIAGKDPQGSLGKDDEEDEDEESEEEAEEKKKKDMDKAEGKNSEADPDAGHHKAAGAMDKAETGMPVGTSAQKAEGKNSEADPDAGHHKPVHMQKSLDEHTALIKGYVDERFSSFESKLETITKLVRDIADSPAPAKSVSYKDIAPLKKSIASEEETLTKSDLINKLFELKKTGVRVDSTDIVSAELGNGPELHKIANKYNIK